MVSSKSSSYILTLQCFNRNCDYFYIVFRFSSDCCPRRWSWPQACQRSRGVWTMLLDTEFLVALCRITGWTWSPFQFAPFQFGVFYISVTPDTKTISNVYADVCEWLLPIGKARSRGTAMALGRKEGINLWIKQRRHFWLVEVGRNKCHFKTFINHTQTLERSLWWQRTKFLKVTNPAMLF